MRRSEPVPRRSFAPRAAVIAALLSALTGATVGLLILFTGAFAGPEQDTLAARFSLRGSHRPTGIVVVGIDDHSFSELRQRWPFPRSWHGEVLRRLHSAGARTVFYDVQFSEPTTPTQDMSLFNALGDTGGAVLATTDAYHGHSDVLGGDANLAQVHSRAAAAFLPVGQGGVVERFPYLEGGLPTVAVAVAQRLGVRVSAATLHSGAQPLIDFQGPPGTIPTLSFADVLTGHFNPAAVRGKIVVVGATSYSLQDVHPTPASSGELMTGPELQAEAIWTLLHGIPLRPLPQPLAILLIVLLSGLAPLVRVRRPAPTAVLLAIGGAAVFLVATQLLFDHGTVLPVVAPLLSVATATVAMLLSSHLLVTLELRATQLEIVQRLGNAAEARDGETGRHLERMGIASERLAMALGWSRREARVLRQASALHDVGKIAIPDEVLLKPGRFDAQERAVMETHATRGADLLSGSSTSLIQMAEEIARSHHERWDGTGYPAGLAGAEIPLAARICGICDVFDALISRRRYKDGWTLEAALEAISDGAGSQFDPRLANVFLRIAPRLYRDLVERHDPDLSDPPVPAEIQPALGMAVLDGGRTAAQQPA